MAYLERVSQPSMVQLARMGDFRAIAYWLNASLVPQGIYARVASDRPGVLLVLLEFMRMPRRDRLHGLVCHRLCRLNSRVIRGVRILARFVDSDDILWDSSIRLVVPAHRTRALPSGRRRSRRRPPARPLAADRRTVSPTHQRAANLRRIQTLVSIEPPTPALPAAPALAALPPSGEASGHAPRRTAHPSARRPGPSRHHRSRRRRVTPRPPALRLTPKALQRIGSAAAAIFVLGWGVETWKQANIGATLSDWLNQRTSVRTASGRVPVIEGGQPSNNPIVTLTFAGGGPLSQTPTPIAGAEQSERSSTAEAATATQSGDTQRTASSAIAPSTPNGTARTSSSTDDPIPLAARPLPRSDVMLANLNQPMAIADPTATTSTPFKDPDTASIHLVNVSGQGVVGAGSDELVKTLDSLQQAGMHPVGAGRNRQEARLPEIVEVRGKRIAYLSYSDASEFAAGRRRPGNNPALGEAIAEDIQTIRSQVDWVVVNYHWNQPLSSYPADWQTQLARSAIDQGADLVVGYHPETLQGAEIYKGRVIAYSLGNFIFANQNPDQTPQTTYDSAVLKVSLKDDRMRLEFIPVEVQGDRAAIATGEKAKDIMAYIEQASALFEQPMKSPAILDRLALDPNQPSPPAEFNGSPEAENKPTPPASDSFITYPSADEASPITPQKSPDQTEATPEPISEPSPATDDLESREGSGVDASSNRSSDRPAPALLGLEQADAYGESQTTPESKDMAGTATESKELEPDAWMPEDASEEEPGTDGTDAIALPTEADEPTSPPFTATPMP